MMMMMIIIIIIIIKVMIYSGIWGFPKMAKNYSQIIHFHRIF